MFQFEFHPRSVYQLSAKLFVDGDHNDQGRRWLRPTQAAGAEWHSQLLLLDWLNCHCWGGDGGGVGIDLDDHPWRLGLLFRGIISTSSTGVKPERMFESRSVSPA